MKLGITAVVLACLAWNARTAAGTDAPGCASLPGGNLGTYKTLADETWAAFKAGDPATAKKKAKELEKAWDTTSKAELAKKQDLWKEIDTALDSFIDPILKEDKPDAAKVESAYQDFLAKLKKAA